MATNPEIKLKLNPGRLAAIIDSAVTSSTEIVNFHFRALSTADLSSATESPNVRFRFSGPNMSAENRRAMHESWILAKAFQDLLRAVRHSLEETYLFISILAEKHSIKSNATLDDFFQPFRRKAQGMKFPDLLETVNNRLDTKIEFSSAYASLQIARNCLEHRAGIVTKVETHSQESFDIQTPTIKAFYMRRGEEIEIEPGHQVDPGDDRKDVDILMKIQTKRRTLSIGERITFSLAEFGEIAFACHLLGQQLSTKLPKPIAEASSPNHAI